METICPRVLGIQPSRYLNPISAPATSPNEVFSFKTIMRIMASSFVYYCNFTVSGSSGSSRIVATLSNNDTLQCNLSTGKGRIESTFRASPIDRKLVNVFAQIRASAAKTKSANTQLYAFNCSFFTDCAQCLSRQLSERCVWCAWNSRCVFASAPRDDFYSHSANSNKDLCTSFSAVRKNVLDTSVVDEAAITSGKQSAAVNVDIPISAKTNLAPLAKLNLKNVKEHQKSFVCLFTKTRKVIVNAFSKRRRPASQKAMVIFFPNF
jgi:hypothetical protein